MIQGMSTAAVAVLLVFVIVGSALATSMIGKRVRERRTDLREPTGALQTALLGFVGLLLAFGLSMAIDRHDQRRASVAEETNTIGTTYLRAQTLKEPERSASLRLLAEYLDARIDLADQVPDSAGFDASRAVSSRLHARLWALADAALVRSPIDSAPRLYVESLNRMIDMDTTRASELRNHIPGAVTYVMIFGSAAAMGALGFYLGLLGRSAAALWGGTVAALILFVTINLDRPRRGFIRIPDRPLTELREEIRHPPPALGPSHPPSSASR